MSIQSEIDRINGTVQTQTDLIAQIKTALENKAGGNGGVTLPTLNNAAASADIRSGKETIDQNGEILVGSLPDVTQATPSITVSTAGKITASATQSAGYVAAGTKSETKQLTVQAAKTVTPSASDQTAVASGRYTTGTVTVEGDSNLVPGNIKSGVSIFGVAGSYEGSSSGGGGSVETCYCLIGCEAPTGDYFTANYTNADMQPATRMFDMTGTRIEVPKGTIVTITPWSSTAIVSGECTKILESSQCGVYSVTGDCQVNFGG